MYKLKLLVADSTKEECETLGQIIHAENMDMQVSFAWGDGIELSQQIQVLCPDIVLLEVELPRLNGLDIVHITKSKGYHCHFVLMSAQRNFDYVYTALKYHADDYLLKPIQSEEVNNALMQIASEIRQAPAAPLPLSEHLVAGRYIFIAQVCADPSYSFHSLEDINKTYGTSFQDGIFCALFVKLDCHTNIMTVYENASFLHDGFESLIRSRLGVYCYDILFDRRMDGILFLANYDRNLRDNFSNALDKFFDEAKLLASSFPALRVTLCIGREYEELSHPYDIKNDALDARWLRMSLGTERIIRHQDAPSEDPFPLKHLSQQIIHSCEILDVDTFKASMDAFFNLPYSILSSRASRKFIRKIINLLLQMNNSLTAPTYNTNAFKQELDFLLNMSANFEQYHKTFNTHISKLMSQISESSNTQYSPSVRQGMNYIRLHYEKPISLSEVAAYVELSPNYLSELFKKETGQNFSDYLISHRIDQAKRLLCESDYNITEIANRVGYSDVRYFGKLFKKRVGTTPSKYKKIHHM